MQKMRTGTQCICFLICITAFLSLLPASAEGVEIQIPSMEEATAVYFYHIEQEELIASKNEDIPINAGSTAKVMA